VNWPERMDKALEYIEQNLDGEIDYIETSRIYCASLSKMQSLFQFVADMTLSEYVRKRRMSRVAEDLFDFLCRRASRPPLQELDSQILVICPLNRSYPLLRDIAQFFGYVYMLRAAWDARAARRATVGAPILRQLTVAV